MILPFDAHNHVHMGPKSPLRALVAEGSASVGNNGGQSRLPDAAVSGMAIMSTHPRDFDRVLQLSKTLPAQVEGNVRIVPCFGVHPWFLHELSDEDWQPTVSDGTADDATNSLPKWIQQLEALINATPNAIVGEIGLDGFHFDPNTNDLVSPMEKQVKAFRLQMELAARAKRPVSIHTVKCFGPLFEALNQLKKDATKNKIDAPLPPKMYFHAFGGKIGTIDQLLALCGQKSGQVYFGFAPIINFRSPKTAQVVRKIGVERLVLESDHEDASYVPESMDRCIQFLSSALEMNKQEIIERTTVNAFDLYGLN
jgi:Tat protein secretion system quality control protein TatD with DNase activity